jgi:F0F1-type ATP synthase membrane subunit b/b'
MDYHQLALMSVVASAVLFAAVLVYGFRAYLAPAVAAAQRVRNHEIAVAEERRDEAVREVQALRLKQERFVKSLEEARARSEVEARRERERIIAEARREGERLVRHADGEFERSRQAAHARMLTRLGELSLARARVQARAETTAEVDRALIERFIEKVQIEKVPIA